MNNLNSVILEGKFKSITISEGQVDFIVATTRMIKVPKGDDMEVTTEVPCRAVGSLAESIKKFAEPGLGVRVVGLLQGPLNGSVFILCEHTEYKLGKKTKKTV